MEQISRIGMDTSKHFFQLHGVNAAEKVVLRKKLRRKEMVAFFKALAPTVIGIEACGASHHWARLLRSFGHEVKLIAPQLVKPYVKRGKNDAADAEALCEAMSRPTMRFVPVKTAEQQAALMMVGLRDRLIRNRTQLSNAIRGYAAEFGFTAAKGKAHSIRCSIAFKPMRACPSWLASCSRPKLKNMRSCRRKSTTVDAKLMAWHKADECSRRLAKIPGVGPIGAALLMHEDPGARAVPIGATVRRLDRLDAEGPFDGGQGQARRHHSGWRRGLAQRVGRWRDFRRPTRSTRRARIALDRRPSQAQTAEVGRRGAGQQNGPRRLEADGHRRAATPRNPRPPLWRARRRDQPDTGSNSTATVLSRCQNLQGK